METCTKPKPALSLLFPTFDLLYDKKIKDTTMAEKHFEMRLFKTLPWLQLFACVDEGQTVFADDLLRIATPIPKDVRMEPSVIQDQFRIVHGSQVKLRRTTSKAQIHWEAFNFLLVHKPLGYKATPGHCSVTHSTSY